MTELRQRLHVIKAHARHTSLEEAINDKSTVEQFEAYLELYEK